MRRLFGVTAVVLVSIGGCSSAGPSGDPAAQDPVATTASPIQGGTEDTTDSFAVGVVQLMGNTVAYCSGALLAPNLVATARHCVAQLTSTEIDCSTSTFGAVVPTSNIYVTTSATIDLQTTRFYSVASVTVPSAANQAAVCGNDIALLILDKSITLPRYVVPAIDPPMTDHTAYSTSITAIGYGIDTPTDTQGTSAGIRRIKERVPLHCIPNDSTFVDCFSQPSVRQFMTAGEFWSGDGSTCEGDSGSSAYDQASFDEGQWVSFGVLSRGGVSADGQTCAQPIYTRFDAWASLIKGAAMQAAAEGGYTAPAWATGGSTAPMLDASAPAPDASAADGSGTAKADAGGTPPSKLADGAKCSANESCQSDTCYSLDGTSYVCVSPCGDPSCPAASQCVQGYCFPTSPTPASATPTSSTSQSGGCNAAGGAGSAPWGAWAGAALGLAAVFTRRRARMASVGPSPKCRDSDTAGR
jgi:V8-like Glu-specific endopeptidase